MPLADFSYTDHTSAVAGNEAASLIHCLTAGALPLLRAKNREDCRPEVQTPSSEFAPKVLPLSGQAISLAIEETFYTPLLFLVKALP